MRAFGGDAILALEESKGLGCPPGQAMKENMAHSLKRDSHCKFLQADEFAVSALSFCPSPALQMSSSLLAWRAFLLEYCCTAGKTVTSRICIVQKHHVYNWPWGRASSDGHHSSLSMRFTEHTFGVQIGVACCTHKLHQLKRQQDLNFSLSEVI